MAREEIFFGINIDTGEAIKDFGTLKNRTKALKKELDGTKVGTKRFEQLKTEITKNQATIRRFNRELRDTKSLATRVSQGMTNAFKKVGGVIAGAFAVREFFNFSKQVADVTSQFEKLEAVLSNTLGSKGAAKKAFSDIKKFASETNFSVLELSDAFVKLANQGFVPTIDEMGNLADIANSTGKSFDQLAEAIIDAQVGEFERLKEFGIRASKSGDQVKFTFKGVETQVKGTEAEIRKYILSLGDLNGVTGATDKISKTLGGAISNLGDAFDSFLASLGETDSFLGSAIRNVVDLSSGFLKLITPTEKASESLSKQKLELNLLVQRITDTNTKESERLKLINELNNVYPGFLKNQKAEKVNNEQIRDRLQEVNKLLIKKLTLQLQQEEVEEKALEAAKIQKEFLDDDKRLRVELNEAVKKYGLNIDLTTGNLEDNANAIRSMLDAQSEIIRYTKEGEPVYNRQYKTLLKVSEAYGFYKSTQEDLLEIEEEVRTEQEKKEELIQRLFGGLDPNKVEEVKQQVEPIAKEVGKSIGKGLKKGVKEEFDITQALSEIEGATPEGTEQEALDALSQMRTDALLEQSDREVQIELDKQRKIKEIELQANNARLESMSSLLQGTLSILSRDEEARKKNAKIIKAVAIADIVTNTQRALLNVDASGSSPLFLPNLLTGGAAGITIAQVQKAAILAQSAASVVAVASQKFQRGGIIQGASHANGGVPVKMANGGMVEAEGGEAIINKKSTAQFAPILSAINSYGGNGDKFERGGLLGVPSTSPVGDTTNAQLLGALNNINFNPTVSVIEINEAQTRINELNTSSQL